MAARERRATRSVEPGLFRMVYESPRSLPGRHKWVTSDEDVREIERLLGLPAKSIGAPLWVSGDTRLPTYEASSATTGRMRLASSRRLWTASGSRPRSFRNSNGGSTTWKRSEMQRQRSHWKTSPK